jgi:hypothetical protein
MDHPKAGTKRILESSEERRNRRVAELLKDDAVKAAIQRDQRPKVGKDKKSRSPRLA